MSFNIIRNDITQLEVDAIVNAANSKLQAGGGVCGAIFSAAGKEELQKECNKIGYCGVGEAVITKGYKTKTLHIIHTVGPIYGQDSANEERQLYLCYENSLKLAKRKHLKSIAFPVISSGIYGYPKAEAIKIATRAIKEFLETNEMDIYLVVYDSMQMKEAIEKTLQENMIPNCKVFIYEGLVAEYTNENNVGYMIRGLRNNMDYNYEENIAEVNKLINPDLEYVYFRAENVAVSSSMVKELNGFGKDVSKFVPTPVLDVMSK